MKKKSHLIIAAFVLLAAIVVAESSFVVTYPNEYTIIKQFGKIESVRREPGLSFKVPFIQTAETIQNEVLLYDLAVSDVMTKDKKSMIADCFVLWRIEDPYKYTQTLSAQKSNAEFRIDNIVYNSLKNVISSLSQEEVISGRASLPRLLWRTSAIPWSSMGSPCLRWRPNPWIFLTRTRARFMSA